VNYATLVRAVDEDAALRRKQPLQPWGARTTRSFPQPIQKSGADGDHGTYSSGGVSTGERRGAYWSTACRVKPTDSRSLEPDHRWRSGCDFHEQWQLGFTSGVAIASRLAAPSSFFRLAKSDRMSSAISRLIRPRILPLTTFGRQTFYMSFKTGQIGVPQIA
jgi:hypothetical protein